MDPRERLARDLFARALAAVEPRRRTRETLRGAGLDPGEFGVLALGKAAATMLEGLLDVGRPRWALGVGPEARELDGFSVLAGGHPLPTQASLDAGAAVWELAGRPGPVLVLLSGGASALCEHLRPGLTLHDLRAGTEARMAAGADIAALNAWRRTVSRLKGGGLLERLAGPVVNLVLSDVLGPVQLVGSGPTLRPDGSGARTLLVADNRTAVQAMAGPDTLVWREPLRGEARDAGRAFAQAARASGARIVVAGGETTVTVRGSGRGGRNQELALGARPVLGDAVLLAAGTDGIDGTSDHAGAVVGPWTPDGAAALADNDSHRFFATHGGAVLTGPTGTNVADVTVWVSRSG